MPSPYEECRQCPRKCGVNRAAGQKGFCGEDASLRAAVACLHFGEEPPVTVWGGSGTIFLSGCTLRCAFCQNYQISQKGYGSPVKKDDFIRICASLQAAGAENINLVTPSHQIPLLAEYIAAAKEAGVFIPFCWNSSGYESTESLELLRGLIDIWLPDLKTLDPNLSKRLFDAADYPAVAKAAVEWMMDAAPLCIEEKAAPEMPASGTSQSAPTTPGAAAPKISDPAAASGTSEPREKIMRGVIVRHLFLPGRFAQSADVLDYLKHCADGRAMISLMSQYTPVPFDESREENERRRKALGAIENRLVSREEDGDLRDLIEAYDFEYLFYQELSADTDWLPDFTQKQPFPNKLARVIWKK